MEVFRNYYFDVQEQSSSSSDSSSSVCKINFSDDEVILASNNPKKRAGRKKFREMRHPIYRDVRRRDSGKWVCEMREPNKKSRIWLGTHQTAEMAARAHDVAAIALRGRSACLNFADSGWRLRIPTSGVIKDIQKAAAEAAYAFRPMAVEEEATSSDDNATREDSTSTSLPENLLFIDEEEIFSMPRLLTDMAEGLMLPLPHYCVEDNDAYSVESNAEMFLWSYLD